MKELKAYTLTIISNGVNKVKTDNIRLENFYTNNYDKIISYIKSIDDKSLLNEFFQSPEDGVVVNAVINEFLDGINKSKVLRKQVRVDLSISLEKLDQAFTESGNEKLRDILERLKDQVTKAREELDSLH